MPKHAFKARIIVEDGGTSEIDVWDDELSPFDGTTRPVREWVREHIQCSYSDADLRELLELPAEGNFEVLIEGTIRGFFSGWGIQEYDEELDLTSIKSQRIPDSWYEDETFLPLDAPKEG